MDTDHHDVLVRLAHAALEADEHEDLDGRALQILAPTLGDGPARDLLTASADAGTLGDRPPFLRDVAHLLRVGHERIDRERGLRAHNEQLAASERLTRLLLESAGEGVYAIDLQGSCIMANREAVRLLGYDDEGELLGRNMHHLVHHTRPDGSPYPEAECRIFQAYREGKGVVRDDEVLFRQDGTGFPVEYRSYPIAQEDGSPRGSILTFFDITERKAAQEQLLKLHADRRATALALHDNVVQALATANYARALGEEETGTHALEQALETSQALVSQLLADSPISEEVLVRSEPSDADGRAL